MENKSELTERILFTQVFVMLNKCANKMLLNIALELVMVRFSLNYAWRRLGLKLHR